MTTMLYKHPGAHELHNDKFDYIIVEDSEIAAKVAEGWSLTTTEAKTPKPISREELLAVAASLNIDVTAKMSDQKIKDLIAATEDDYKNHFQQKPTKG